MHALALRRTRESERSRIARDLHDQLGASLTEIVILAERGRNTPDANLAAARFENLVARVRELVVMVDEIVWVVDPRKDSAAAFGRYLVSHVEDYLGAANVTLDLDIPKVFPDPPLAAETRHQ